MSINMIKTHQCLIILILSLNLKQTLAPTCYSCPEINTYEKVSYYEELDTKTQTEYLRQFAHCDTLNLLTDTCEGTYCTKTERNVLHPDKTISKWVRLAWRKCMNETDANNCDDDPGEVSPDGQVIKCYKCTELLCNSATFIKYSWKVVITAYIVYINV